MTQLAFATLSIEAPIKPRKNASLAHRAVNARLENRGSGKPKVFGGENLSELSGQIHLHA